MYRKQVIEEQDACAIIAFVDKRGNQSHANIVKTIEALCKMAHRSGDINGEGDGCGILIDIPRDIWASNLEQKGLSFHLAEARGFFVGHFYILAHAAGNAATIMERVRLLFKQYGADLLMELQQNMVPDALGPRARQDMPIFWQLVGIMPGHDRHKAQRELFKLHMEIATHMPEVHVISLSNESVNYTLRGLPELLPRVYPDLLNPASRSAISLGHSRYSTNTLPTVERAQPFTVLGHNGEINTIERLRSASRHLGIEPVPDGSDSQDLNRLLEGLINLYGFDPMEALELIFPPVHTIVKDYSQELQTMYAFYRWFLGVSAQGPAAVVARYGDAVLGSVDALGLRPLWFGESDYDYFLSSEKGVIDLEYTINDPRPLGPGEKIGIVAPRGKRADVLSYDRYQERLLHLMEQRKGVLDCIKFLRSSPVSPSVLRDNQVTALKPLKVLSAPVVHRVNLLAAFGWHDYDLNILSRSSLEGKDVVGSMGHQGPLAALMPENALPNVSDYFKEEVAVVTNPAIDREREAEHFNTQVILGKRPQLQGKGLSNAPPMGFVLHKPFLLDAGGLSDFFTMEELQTLSQEVNVAILEEVMNFFSATGRNPSGLVVVDATCSLEEGMRERLNELCEEVKAAVLNGAALVLLDDTNSFQAQRVFIDPGVATVRVVKALEEAGLRRHCSIIVRSGAIRNLHDIMFLLGMGADAISPYLMWQEVCKCPQKSERPQITCQKAMLNAMDVLQKGIEKVMSTMGIHELCGYGRIFASIGLQKEFAELFGTRAFCVSEQVGLGYARLEAQAKRRYDLALSKEEAKLYADSNKNPKYGRILRSVAQGKKGYEEMAIELMELQRQDPTAIRHVLDFQTEKATPVPKDAVDIGIDTHAMPILIAAMSFGSQGENSFRTYAEAAKRVNIICMNGEGGEIPDMLGKYRHNRGQQIASGRFGVFMGLLNSADYLEIKIGQGAKPGEGGHLPGAKVSEMVAKARHCKPGIALISPSNQHDIYSIEDLAQIITELKTANPFAKVSVKIPVTGNVGTIAVGIAKAGADIVNLSGFEGGTGAAREHAKKYVGMCVEVGVSEAHRALVASGLRDKVEIWCDGGVRSGADVVKLILLGANRVGMGTVALMGVGCISCQRCHLDRCPKGISTQLRTKSDAEARGVKGFQPRVVETEVENLSRLLLAIGEEIRMWCAKLGISRLQDAVGRVELLTQWGMKDRLCVSSLLAPVQEEPISDSQAVTVLRRPLNYLTKLISNLAMESIHHGAKDIYFVDDHIRSTDRAVVTYLAGEMVRHFQSDGQEELNTRVKLHLRSSVPGNGLCAFNIAGLYTLVEGGGQDGVAKGAIGGGISVLKGVNYLGRRIDGSVGKSFGYGAINGFFIVQNYADSRACVRMSGADVVFGARITSDIKDEGGNLAIRSHLKGFAFEYMTGGRAVVLGDPGPWICAGMTGGVVYQCLYPEFGFTKTSLKRRLARGADVSIHPIDEVGLMDVNELLERYAQQLDMSLQVEEAQAVRRLLDEAKERFVMILPNTVKLPAQ